MHYSQLLALVAAAVAPAAAADNVVTSLLLPYNDPNDFVASVANVDQTATTFVYTCAGSVSPDDCGMDQPGTIVQGPSTWQMTLSNSNSEDGAYSMSANCALTSSKNQASCTIVATYSDTETHGSSSTIGMTTGYISELLPVTITGGLDKLSGGAVPTATTASPTSGGKSTGSASHSSSSGASSTTGGSKSTSSPNAAPAATQHALLAGVAAVVGALAL
ncbi:hypothetical protein PWT90_00854 [Aphanocladium album]|nr:hypothetical protein PWT90_00854 [Aphanocladium album]